MRFEPFNESRTQEEIDKLQDNLRDDISVLVNQWEQDIHECLFDLLDNYEYSNKKVTWDLKPRYSISKYNRQISSEIISRCNLKYNITFNIKPLQVDEFIEYFNYVKDFLKSHLDANIEVYDYSVMKNDSMIRSMSGHWTIEKLIEELNKVKKDSDLTIRLKMKIY